MSPSILSTDHSLSNYFYHSQTNEHPHITLSHTSDHLATTPKTPLASSQDTDLQNDITVEVEGCSEYVNARLATQARHLPIDVMIEVFKLCCPTPGSRRHLISPIILCCVCRGWRDLAMGLPDLWTYLQLRVVRFELDGPLATIRLWLSRVKNRPLVVDVTFLEDSTAHSPLNILRQVNKVLDSVSTFSPAPLAQNRLTAAITSTSLPCSGQTALEMYTWAGPEPTSGKHSTGSVQINITRQVDIVYGLEGHTQLSSYLTVIDLADPRGMIELAPEEGHNILSSFPMLEKCSLRLGRSPSPLMTVPHLMMHLKILSLSWSNVLDSSNVLNAIYAPYLEFLELDGLVSPPSFIEDVGWFQPELMEFLERSQPPLRVLELSKVDLGGIDLLSCLALTGNLYALLLEDCTIDETYRRLCVQGWHPHHEEARRALLNIEMVHLVSCTVGMFVDMLLAFLADEEVRSQVHLTDLRVYDCGRFPQEVLLDLERWSQLHAILSPVGPDFTVFI